MGWCWVCCLKWLSSNCTNTDFRQGEIEPKLNHCMCHDKVSLHTLVWEDGVQTRFVGT